MPELDVLNDPDPSTDSVNPLNPDFPFGGARENHTAMWRARRGPTYRRTLQVEPMIYNLVWAARPLSTARALQQWARNFRNSFFSFYDPEFHRYFSGNFTADPVMQQQGNEQWNVQATFLEQERRPMKEYPSNWDDDGFLIEEQDADGNALVYLSGSGWGLVSNGNAHGGKEYDSSHQNDTAIWAYMGYGFRIWGRTGPNLGIAEISLDGTVVATADFYSALDQAAGPVKLSTGGISYDQVMLDTHKVQLRVTGTKNAASTGFSVPVDAIEVML